MAPLLEVSDLRVSFEGNVEALCGVSLSLDSGQSLAIVGESGAGKTTLAQCMVGLVAPSRATGSVRVKGQEIIGAPEEVLRRLRWKTVALALQGAPFNPVASVGSQVSEPLRERAGLSAAEAGRRAAALADEVLLDPAKLARFPHQLSGGERRRAMLAMALALDPELLILDEPAAGLDPVTKHELIGRIGELARRRGFALIVVSHDLPAAIALAQRTVVLYAGEAMEVGESASVLDDAAHPYTWSLVRAYPMMTTTKDLRPIRGRPPDSRAIPPGCPFHPRCTQAETICIGEHADLRPSRGRLVACHFGGVRELLRADGVGMTYRGDNQTVRALAGVSLMVRHGESVGIVGASGSGKTTLARIISGDLAPGSGTVMLGEQPVSGSWRREQRAHRRSIQLVRQDPWDALSPRLTIAELVREPLDLDGEDREAGARAVAEMLIAVGLPTSEDFLASHSHNLSGGELQRVALARALSARPKLLVADEPTSMLDASEQARLLVVLRELQVEQGLALVLVSHDLAVVRKVTDRTLVLDAGQVAEDGPSEHVCTNPTSAAGRRLIAAAGSPRSDVGEPNREDIWTTA